MTTDVINGVPMEQIRAALTKVEDVLEAAYHNAYPECCGRAGQECCGDAVQAWSEADQKIMDVLSPIRRGLSDILATAQPAAEVIETDCRSEEGVTVGLIDALIAICRPLATRDLATPAACAALEDLRSDSDALAIFLGLPPAADGEREVWAVPVLDGEKKTTFYTEQLPFVPGIGVKQLGEPVRMVEARAALSPATADSDVREVKK